MSRSGSEPWLRRLDAWLEPFLAALPRAAQRRWAPLYVRGLLLPGERKSVEPMAARVCPGQVQQLHHFVSASTWPHERLERILAERADRLVGGPDAVLVVDDTALVKQGRHSVGVQRQYCGQLGKKANCQALVSLTLARGEVPVPVALRLFLPERWAGDASRRERAGVPPEVVFRPKWRVALDEIGRLRAQGVRFGCVLGDAEYGKVAAFLHVGQSSRFAHARRPRPSLGRRHPAQPEAVPARRHHRHARAQEARLPAQAPRARQGERARGLAVREPARRRVPYPVLVRRTLAFDAHGHQRAVAGGLQRTPHEGGGRSRDGEGATPAGRRSLAGVRAPRHRRAQVPLTNHPPSSP